MKCPTDLSPLQLAERHGIEIDYCPECRGVWLDRGELDKIVDRAAGDSAPTAASHRPDRDVGPIRSRDDRDRREDDDLDDDDRYQRTGRRRRSSFLGDLFDLG